MLVSVYRVDNDGEELIALPDHGESAYALTLIRLAHNIQFSGDIEPKQAAAKALFDTVIQYRQVRLANMQAPQAVQEQLATPERVANHLVDTCLLPGTSFLLDNQVECWLINVDSSD